MDPVNVLNNAWWVWFWNNYSMSILGIPTAITFILKGVAIFHPGIPTDKVRDLFKEFWPTGKPGG